MGHQTTVLRDMYQKLWLGENLPYFLGNILARYDRGWGAGRRLRTESTAIAGIYDQRALPPLLGPAEPAAK